MKIPFVNFGQWGTAEIGLLKAERSAMLPFLIWVSARYCRWRELPAAFFGELSFDVVRPLVPILWR